MYCIKEIHFVEGIMRRTTDDKTLERNYEQKWKFLISEYEVVKKGKHLSYRFVNDFYMAHGLSRQTFNKYYHRYLQSGDSKDLRPRKRGPRWKSRRPESEVEVRVLEARNKGLNRYEVCQMLRPELGEKTPSPSGAYNIFKRFGVNRLKVPMKIAKQKIIKEKAGEMAHIDCHYLSQNLLLNETKRYYLVCVIDAASRMAWAEVVEDIKSLTVMFASLKCFNLLSHEYQIRFKEVLSDNGSEFCGRTKPQEHPFERMLLELGIKHRYTKPYRPQTNGKVERFWRTLNEDLIEFTNFDSLEHFKKELKEYLLYYNHLRPHQGLNGVTPVAFLEKLLSTN